MRFTKAEAQRYLHDKIPITRQLGIEVHILKPDEVVLKAPLSLNSNHLGSAFGGSVDSLFLTTGWAYLRVLTDHLSHEPTIIGKHAETTFYQPIRHDFSAHIIVPDKKTKELFLSEYEINGKAKIILEAVITDKGKIYAGFKGTYVLLKGSVRI